MHDEVEAAPGLLDLGEGVVDALEVGHVAVDDDLRADRLGERDGAPAEGVALVGEGELGALAGQHAGDAPGDRALVGDAHDEAALARHQRARAWQCRSSSWPSSNHAVRGPRGPAREFLGFDTLATPAVPRQPKPRANVRACPHASHRLITRVALVPPKPKLFDMTQLRSRRPAACARWARRRTPDRARRCWRSRR